MLLKVFLIILCHFSFLVKSWKSEDFVVPPKPLDDIIGEIIHKKVSSDGVSTKDTILKLNKAGDGVVVLKADKTEEKVRKTNKADNLNKLNPSELKNNTGEGITKQELIPLSKTALERLEKLNTKYKPLFYSWQEDGNRKGKDLVYEKMVMRSGFTETRKDDLVKPVGGGILEQQLMEGLLDPTGSDVMEGRQGVDMEMLGYFLKAESREMQCCDDLEVRSSGGVYRCHPYVLGPYRKIGVCGGKSFYQHRNNTDIFLYHACGAWYFGLEVGSCGGWILVKSLELCASAHHSQPWQFYDNGALKIDSSFQVVEACHFYSDFRPVPTVPTRAPKPTIPFQERPSYPSDQRYPGAPMLPNPVIGLLGTGHHGHTTQRNYGVIPTPTTGSPATSQPIQQHVHYHISLDANGKPVVDKGEIHPKHFVNENRRTQIGGLEIPEEESLEKDENKPYVLKQSVVINTNEDRNDNIIQTSMERHGEDDGDGIKGTQKPHQIMINNFHIPNPKAKSDGKSISTTATPFSQSLSRTRKPALTFETDKLEIPVRVKGQPSTTFTASTTSTTEEPPVYDYEYIKVRKRPPSGRPLYTEIQDEDRLYERIPVPSKRKTFGSGYIDELRRKNLLKPQNSELQGTTTEPNRYAGPSVVEEPSGYIIRKKKLQQPERIRTFQVNYPMSGRSQDNDDNESAKNGKSDDNDSFYFPVKRKSARIDPEEKEPEDDFNVENKDN